MARNRQLSLLGPAMTADLVPDPGADYGEVFTRQWVVEFILDLVGYVPERDLAAMTIVEPSCGTGAFLLPIIDRLVESCGRHGRDVCAQADAVRAFDLLSANAERANKAVVGRLLDAGIASDQAEAVADRWVRVDDFLLSTAVGDQADFVVGNPPYIRLENVPTDVMQAYRDAWPAMRGRSDIYVGFIQRGLELLAPGGALGFICADRWMRNQYGADLREFVSGSYAVDTIVTMHDVDAFEDEVSAYPAVIILKNEGQKEAVVAEASGAFSSGPAAQLTSFVRHGRRRVVSRESFEASRLDRWFEGRDLWPAGSPAQLAMVADLEARFPPLEDNRTGTRVGIGVATGCDDVYITSDSGVVEPDRLLPLLQAGDITDGSACWSGQYLVNPWNGSGLVNLDRYPRLRAYLGEHEGRLRARHTAKKRAEAWYRTIDKVDPQLQGRRKLVLPDLKAFSHPVLDDGSHYPHHNLYFVVSDEWELEVLGGLLLSDFANLFVGTYCVKMRGGCYRFQAQYIRRIRVPEVASVDVATARDLRRAFRDRDRTGATLAASTLYGIEADRITAALS